MQWQPVLDGELASRAWSAIERIGHDLALSRFGELQEYSLAEGAAGISLFFSYLASARSTPDDEDHAIRFLELAHDRAGAKPTRVGLFTGLVGVAWATEHLTGERIEPVERMLEDRMDSGGQEDPFDLTTGVAGHVVYALNRCRESAPPSLLSACCRRLLAMALPSPGAPRWWVRPDWQTASRAAEFEGGHLDLGVAHGSPGVIGVLGRVAGCPHAPDELRTEARQLLHTTLAELLTYELEDGPRGRFPSCIGKSRKSTASRLAWCSGDLGIACALLVAARAVGDAALEREAVATGLRAIGREFTWVVDAGLCHGSAGIALLFSRLFNTTGQQVFRDAARQWFGDVLARQSADGGIGGFTTPTAEGPVAHPGLLLGASGIGLCLLAGVAELEPSWDEILVCSPC